MTWRLVVIALFVMLATADAADWGSIVPGDTTMEAVRTRYGLPVSRRTEKVEGYDTTEWVYEGQRVPRGIQRLTVSFGLLTPSGFRPDVVRLFRLEPVRGVFTQRTVRDGWGQPSAAGREGGWPSLLYDSGLIVIFDRDGEVVREMIFTLPQKR